MVGEKRLDIMELLATLKIVVSSGIVLPPRLRNNRQRRVRISSLIPECNRNPISATFFSETGDISSAIKTEPSLIRSARSNQTVRILLLYRKPVAHRQISPRPLSPSQNQNQPLNDLDWPQSEPFPLRLRNPRYPPDLGRHRRCNPTASPPSFKRPLLVLLPFFAFYF
ncbi:hypothetical protein MRB53_022168 [Persea americana]|uniref:Uncharacterized protein n=1 Tax=Persea americana TaxID=3435 RepID=A0ACC2L5Z2_PERAE|nr:hypothetical protein MRB53_022168 [Persea americana]